MLVDNAILIRERFPSLWEEIQKNKASYETSDSYQVEAAKNGKPTIKALLEGKTVYIHSKYNPQDEAQHFIEKFHEVELYDHVLFYGMGLGYHIELFRERYPTKSFTIYEPVPEVFLQYLANRKLAELSPKQLKSIYVEWNETNLEQSLRKIVSQIRGKVLLVSYSSYERLFPDRTKRFNDQFSGLIRSQLNHIGTNRNFEHNWTLNAMRNLPVILNTPNVIGEKRQVFAGKPVILAAAGPSLEDEFDNLKYIKENGLAYIFAVGSANRSLIKAGIMPDAVTTYDPWTGQDNANVFGEIAELGIDSIPMVFGSTVGFRAVERYPGAKLHMFISQDTVAPYYLGVQQISERKSMLSDAPTISVVTLQLLAILGVSKIILVGQNFAYRNNQYYASGIVYGDRPNEMVESDRRSAVRVKDVYGNDVDTSESFNSGRKQMETYLRQMSGIPCLNATKGGAHIEGTTFVPLETIIQDELGGCVVEPNWYAGEPTAYDQRFVRMQAIAMNTASSDWDKLYDQLVGHFRKFDMMIKNRDAKALSKQFPLFDQTFNRFIRNVYHVVFIKPMTRNQHEVLNREHKQIVETSEPIAKAKAIMEIVGKFVYICGGMKEALKEEFERLQLALLQEDSVAAAEQR